MLQQGPAKKVTVYVGEDVHVHGEPLYLAVLNYLFYRGVSGATVTKGVAGFGSHHEMHTARILEISGNLPVKIEFIEEAGKLDRLLPKLMQMVSRGLVEVQDTTVVSASAPPGDQPEPPRAGASGAANPTDAGAPAGGERTPPGDVRQGDVERVMTLTGRAKMMRIHFGEDDRWQGRHLYEAIVEEARRHDLAGATVYRGIEGYGASTRIHRSHLFTSSDLPIMVAIIDTEEKIAAFLPTVEEMVADGLIAISDVDVIRYTHRGRRNS
ncbi:MAG: DUF190 domain-containing protein [Betaproteobacteria bacterium]